MAATTDYLRALFDHLEMAILIADDEGRYLDANASACRMLGYGREAIIGRTIAMFMEPAGDGAPPEGQWRAFLEQGTQSGVTRLRRGDGSWVELEFNAYANFAPGLHCSFLMERSQSLSPEGDFLTMCAWTKRVKTPGGWLPVDRFLQDAYGLRVSHGICPEALEQL